MGQGDSILLWLPSGEKVLVDGGGFPVGNFDVGRMVLAPYLWSRRFLKVDYIILSHPQPDHYRGLLFVARHFHPEEFWHGPWGLPQELLELLKELRRRGTKVREIVRGFQREIGEARILVLHPPRDWPLGPNEASLVIKVLWQGRSVLLTGDIGKEAEAEMVRNDLPVRSEVLKVPHHGSKSSSSYPFAKEVSPLFAVISVGKGNPFGHPAQRVIRRYEGLGARVLRTDRCGAIQLIGSPQGWDLRTYLKCNASRPLR